MLLESVEEKTVGSLTYNLNASSVPKKPRPCIHFITMPQKKSDWWFCWSKSIIVLDFIHVDQVPYGLLVLYGVEGVHDKLPRWDWGRTTERNKSHLSLYTVAICTACLMKPRIWRNMFFMQMQVTARWQAKAVCSLSWMEVLKTSNELLHSFLHSTFLSELISGATFFLDLKQKAFLYNLASQMILKIKPQEHWVLQYWS